MILILVVRSFAITFSVFIEKRFLYWKDIYHEELLWIKQPNFFSSFSLELFISNDYFLHYFINFLVQNFGWNFS